MHFFKVKMNVLHAMHKVCDNLFRVMVILTLIDDEKVLDRMR